MKEVSLEFKNGTFTVPHQLGAGELKLVVLDLSELLTGSGMRG